MALAFFDLDGTLTRFDTLAPYCLIALVHRPRRMLALKDVLKASVGFSRGVIDRQQWKEAFITVFLEGATKPQIARWNRLFLRYVLPLMLRKQILRKLRKHRDGGDRVYIVSASPDIYLDALVGQWRLDGRICTELEWKHDRLTGKISGRNCRGEEKARRLKALFDAEDLKRSYGYGNSEGDRQMLELVGVGSYV